MYETYCVPITGPSQVGGAPHFLADQLTLSQPGGHIIPTQYYVPPRIFIPCDGPVQVQANNIST